MQNATSETTAHFARIMRPNRRNLKLRSTRVDRELRIATAMLPKDIFAAT